MDIKCPHCDGDIQILQINCGIFRHGVYKDGRQLDPHASKELCDQVVKDNLVYGCAKPFKISPGGKAEKCDYI